MISKVVHGAASGQNIALLHLNFIGGREKHLRKLRRATADLNPFLFARSLVILHHIARVHNAELVSVSAISKRMQNDVFGQSASGLEVLFLARFNGATRLQQIDASSVRQPICEKEEEENNYYIIEYWSKLKATAAYASCWPIILMPERSVSPARNLSTLA